jgi:tRNA1(Val) A37 N6-methylase TrmN6
MIDPVAPGLVTASTDAFVGGRMTAIQPVAGHHRAGLEAVLLAAAVDANFAGTLIDLGAGTGVAGMAVAARCREARVMLAERDVTAAECASAALALPANRAFAGRVSVIAVDALDPAAREAAGLEPASVEAVMMNPPFHDAEAGTAPPAKARAAAYVLEAGLEPWFRAAASLLKPRGALAVIFRADRLDALLAACGRRFGAATILPIGPRAGMAATRVILAARKGSRAPLRLLPPFTLHAEAGGAFLPEAEALLRDGASLSAVHPAWTGIG